MKPNDKEHDDKVKYYVKLILKNEEIDIIQSMLDDKELLNELKEDLMLSLKNHPKNPHALNVYALCQSDFKQREIYYKKAINLGSSKAIANLLRLYYFNQDDFEHITKQELKNLLELCFLQNCYYCNFTYAYFFVKRWIVKDCDKCVQVCNKVVNPNMTYKEYIKGEHDIKYYQASTYVILATCHKILGQQDLMIDNAIKAHEFNGYDNYEMFKMYHIKGNQVLDQIAKELKEKDKLALEN